MYSLVAQHENAIIGVVDLFDDVIASLDNPGKIITWHASSGIVLSPTAVTVSVKSEDNSLVFLDI